MNRQAQAAGCGFTLVELLIVISILAVLAAVLLPQILGTRESANIAATEANLQMLETGIQNWNREHGYYPPDDLKAVEATAKTNWKPDNGRNTGIESLVCFLSQSGRDGLDLGSLADRFTNTDGDDHGMDLPLLRRRERLEIADHWNTPLVYFARQGLERSQQVVPAPDQDAVPVKCRRRADGQPYGAGKFQLLSAGPDLAFGTADDLVWPPN
jgi:prepilin-type N-terminal cleavage/methylation domain-containing protein